MAAHWNGAAASPLTSPPLHGFPTLALTVQPLAGRAVAVLGGERLLAAQLVGDFATVAAGFVARIERGRLVQLIRRILLPLLVQLLVAHGGVCTGEWQMTAGDCCSAPWRTGEQGKTGAPCGINEEHSQVRGGKRFLSE